MTAVPRVFALVLACAALPLACASPDPITAWPYSSWYQAGPADSLGGFKDAREACLEQAGAAADPEAVTKNSAQENAFLECMNAARWCTQAYKCAKSGAGS